MSSDKLPILKSIRAKNYRSLADVDVNFGRFSVLVGPNGSGKSNLLSILRFIRDSARTDISTAVTAHGGFDRLRRSTNKTGGVELTIKAQITEFASTRAPDVYTLSLEQDGPELHRKEEFTYKRTQGRGRRLGFSVDGVDAVKVEGKITKRKSSLTLTDSSSSALGTFARINAEWLGDGPSRFLNFLSSIRYLDPDVQAARQPSRAGYETLLPQAANLSTVLQRISEEDPDAFETLTQDLQECLPGLETIEFTSRGGDALSVVTTLREKGLTQPIELADASFGTVRMLALLAAFHDPTPPPLTVVEEVDHGLHPYALDVLVDRMRQASERTQVIAASHSPTLVNQLAANELILCDRDPATGESEIPVYTSSELTDAQEASERPLGELWYAGILEGVPRHG